MNEKNIELTNINSSNNINTEKQFSFSQNHLNENTININASEVESNDYGTTNTVDINSICVHIKFSHFTNINQNKKNKNKYKPTKGYNFSSIGNFVKKIYSCFFSLKYH